MSELAFDYVVGTGGIGKGILFKLEGDHTLGRNESRLAELTDFRDYCKLHIILNYVAVYMQGKIPIYAIGCVGKDEAGAELLADMNRAGINVEYVEQDANSKTLYAVCYQYPNGEGGNITTSNSACNIVSATHIDRFFETEKLSGKGVVIAAPEVSVDTRIRLLQQGITHGCCNVAAVLSGEVLAFAEKGGFAMVDILAINEDEATAIAALASPCQFGDREEQCIAYLHEQNPNMTVIVTHGKAGACTYYKDTKDFSPAIENVIVNTAGAGDCFIGTAIAALVHKVPLHKTESFPVLSSVSDLAGVSSSLKVSCNDTINFNIDKAALWKFSKEKQVRFSQQILLNFFKFEMDDGVAQLHD